MKKLISIILILFSSYGMAQVLPPPADVAWNWTPITTGLRFSPVKNSLVTGAVYFRASNVTGSSTAMLHDSSGTLITSAQSATGSGWTEINFPQPVMVDSGKQYVISYTSEDNFYTSVGFQFPATFELFKAIQSQYIYSKNTFPNKFSTEQSHSVEPVLIPIIPAEPKDTFLLVVKDTVKIFIDTCTIDYSKLTDLSLVLMIQDEGGTVILPDSTKAYQALYGAAQPHERLKDDLSLILYRFQRSYTINGILTPIRFTLYKTGAWRRELKDSKGIWQNYPYAPY
jgi:hypothetical protein